MGKAAAKKIVTTTLIEDEIETRLAVVTARNQFIGATINLGWRLALTVVIPIVAGVKLDLRFGTKPLYSLLGMVVAGAAGSLAVWATVKEVNAQQNVAPTPKIKK